MEAQMESIKSESQKEEPNIDVIQEAPEVLRKRAKI